MQQAPSDERENRRGRLHWRVHRSAFFWFLLLLAALESGAFIASPYRDHPRASAANRNPTPLRAWPEYVSGSPSDEHKLVVLIATSQGVGLEFADDSQLFFSLLRRDFRREHPDVAMENWSVSGLRTDQLELLSLQAVKRQASLVVFLVSLGNIDEYWKFRLGADAADVDLLAGDPKLWPSLLSTAVFEQARYHDSLLRMLLLKTHLGRSRISILDVAAEHLSLDWHDAAFGGLRPRNARWTVAERLQQGTGIRFNSLFSNRLSQSAEYYEDQYRRHRLPVFEAVYPRLLERFREAGIQMLWVWTPLAAKGFEDTLLAGAKPIQSEICRRIEADDSRCVDATRALTLDHFIVGDIASHLNDKGHEALARLLKPILTDAVH